MYYQGINNKQIIFYWSLLKFRNFQIKKSLVYLTLEIKKMTPKNKGGGEFVHTLIGNENSV